MTLAFSVRRAAFEDAAVIARLSLQLDPELDAATIAQRFARLLERPTHAFFVLDDAGSAVGFAAAEHRSLLQFGERIELLALIVDMPLRRQGAGGSLVAAVEAWAWRRPWGQSLAVGMVVASLFGNSPSLFPLPAASPAGLQRAAEAAAAGAATSSRGFSGKPTSWSQR